MRLFNTPFEIGFRALILLNAYSGRQLDLDALMILDYLTLNSADVNGPESLSAPIPNRGVQVYAKKELLQRGLAILLSKELVCFNHTSEGFKYSISEAGSLFLQLFETRYYLQLVDRSKWSFRTFGEMDTTQLRQLVNNNISEWGSELLIS